jgi:two-component system, chemotaxis family, protein-glutamate methylesterase/glutaminase
VLRTRDIAPTLVKLVNTGVDETIMAKKHPGNSIKRNSGNGSQLTSKPAENINVSYPEEGEGTPSVFACPECHGVLWELKDKELTRFRCRVGHSYGIDSLAKELSHASEGALWAALRALEEKAAMLRRVADGVSDKALSQRLHDQSASDAANARLIRDMIFQRDAELDKSEKPEGMKKSA